MMPITRAASIPSRIPMIRLGMIPTDVATRASPDVGRLDVPGIASITASTLRVRRRASMRVHRAAPIPEQVDRHVGESCIADRLDGLRREVRLDDPRNV